MKNRTLPSIHWCLTYFAIFLLAQSLYSQTKYTLGIDSGTTFQTMDNFGAAACWFGEGVGKYWPSEKKEQIAKLLFSQQMDSLGNPEGIGLSAWRFNIGAGTFEQGDESGIKDFRKRVESFINPDGSYDWSKQEGYLWLVKNAKAYGVEKLIAFSNSPPVYFTKNGRGFKTEKDYTTNLKEDKFDDFAEFLANVISHFKNEGLTFDYISPVNEPQWDWYGKFGEAKQEGSPWSNKDIAKLTKLLDKSLKENDLKTEILLSESAMLTFLYEGERNSHSQVEALFNPSSPNYVGNLEHVAPLIAGHSYFTDTSNERMVDIRRKVKQVTEENNIAFWQSEYSMLGDGFREGTEKKLTAMDCALFLAKVIHFDLTVANASAWQFWNSMEPGNPDFDTRYYFLALEPNEDHTDGNFYPVKTLWAMGHYSYFVRPGMTRIKVQGPILSGELNSELMTSAFMDEKDGKIVMVLINYSSEDIPVNFETEQLKGYKLFQQYLTTEETGMDLKKTKEGDLEETVELPKRSISTLVFQKNKL
ncbi:glycoside hydrolase [Flagellimonas iocasae]|uniref:Glycoside hydrolase n=1 Tax=Flagellimonas iocasae TaxID=2055905 RepID=A0ABW4XUY5_9FLAO